MTSDSLQIKTTYTAFVVTEEDGSFHHSIRQLKRVDLPDHDLLVKVHYSSLNYKDMLSASGNKAVTSQYPFTPGIDASGIVLSSKSPRFKTGDKVIVTSYDLGMNTPGGFGEYISVPSAWALHLPEAISLKESMMAGTSGLTAAIGIKKLVNHQLKPEDGRVAVTGATGAVGSFAVSLFAHLGFKCDAITGKSDQHTFLNSIGADRIIDRFSLCKEELKPLNKSRWVGAIDTVGGSMLDRIIRQISHNGIVACCGNVLGDTFETSIYPFILRGVSLMGIDSGIALMEDRLKIWSLLSSEWKMPVLNDLCRTIELQDLSAEIHMMKEGKQIGKVVIRLPDS